MRYVTKRMVVVLNQIAVNLTGGYKAGQNIREGQSLAFVERVWINEVFGAVLYPTLHDQAAAYMFYIIKNHVFLDGNKRTGLLTAVTFLQWNGVEMMPLQEDEAFEFVMGIAGGPNVPDTEIPKIAAWLRQNSRASAELP